MPNLVFDEPDEITLPAWVGRTSLSLSEIGAVCVLACMQKEGIHPMLERLESREMITASMALQEKGILKVSISGPKVEMLVCLDSVTPADVLATVNSKEGEGDE